MAAVLFAPLLLVGDTGAAMSQDRGYVVFDPSLTAKILQQCSRSTPKPGEAGWTPSDLDIAKLEAKLPAALALARPDLASRKWLEGAPARWLRQYVGIVRGGHRFIYGNFVPDLERMRIVWRQQPQGTCDGGADFFGAEYDVEKGMFSHLAFNG